MKNKKSVQPFWGKDILPQRLAAVLRYATKGSRVLDLGSGRGAYTIALNQRDIPTIGIDQIYYREWDACPKEWFIKSEASTLPFNNNHFNICTAFEVIEHCSSPTAVLSEISRCTTELLIMSVPNCDLNNNLRKYNLALAHWTDPTHCNFFTKNSIVELLQTLKYQIIEVEDCLKISPNRYFWDTLKIPRIVSIIPKWLCEQFNLVETYWSSILIVARVPKD